MLKSSQCALFVQFAFAAIEDTTIPNEIFVVVGVFDERFHETASTDSALEPKCSSHYLVKCKNMNVQKYSLAYTALDLQCNNVVDVTGCIRTSQRFATGDRS